MSLLVHYTLKSPDHRPAQIAAMQALVSGLKAEGIKGLHYSCFTTPEATEFVGILEYPDEATKQAFLDSASCAIYRATVGPLFANPPQTTDISAFASTRG